MSWGVAIGGLIVLVVVFSIFSIVIDPAPVSIISKPLHLARNLLDGFVIGPFWQIAKFGAGIFSFLNPDMVPYIEDQIEKHNVWYGFRQDQHIDCCRPAECYVTKVCVAMCGNCQKTEEDLKTYYA